MTANIAVLISFLLFFGILFYFNVPKMIGGMLDARAERIKGQLDEARAAREDAQTVLASFERKQKEAEAEADEILERAKADAVRMEAQAKADLDSTVARKLKTAEDRFQQAEASVVRGVTGSAALTAVAAAGSVIRENITSDDENTLMDAALDEVARQLG